MTTIKQEMPIPTFVTLTLPEQVELVDAIEVAARIVAHGSRAAISTSTVEIVAMAHYLLKLVTLADVTFDLLITADRAMAVSDVDVRKQLTRAVRMKVSDVGAQLEALGYGKDKPKQEKADGTAS